MKLSELVELANNASSSEDMDDDVVFYDESGNELVITDIVSRKSIIKETNTIEMEFSIK